MKKYQVFVSSTFLDLIDERRAAIDAIMQLGHIPAGMELFGANGEEQLKYIQGILRQSDYYLLIIGGKYGSLSPRGISYTEEEYELAVSMGLKVIAFVHGDTGALPARFVETEPTRIAQMEDFRAKVMQNRLVRFWNNIHDLKEQILSSLATVMREYPATGWVRAESTEAAPKSPETDWEEDDEDTLKLPGTEAVSIGKVDVYHDTQDPHKAVVMTDEDYVQLETRFGTVRRYMVRACEEYLKYTALTNRQLPDGHMFVLRRMWFNDNGPEVAVYMDYMCDIHDTQSLTKEDAKKIFFSGEILRDGASYTVYVRFVRALFRSDSFDKISPAYYRDKQADIFTHWNACQFLMIPGEDKTSIDATIKLTNNDDYPACFHIHGLFEVEDEELGSAGFTNAYCSMQAKDFDMQNSAFTLRGHETRTVHCLFECNADENVLRETPHRLDITLVPDGDEDKYE